MNFLPPLKLLEQWRNEGLSPQEIYERCKEIDRKRKSPVPRSKTFIWRDWANDEDTKEVKACLGCKVNPVGQDLCRRHYDRIYARIRRARRLTDNDRESKRPRWGQV